MKRIKLFTMLLCILGCSFFTSCSKDNDLVGTKWTITYMDTKYIVEFTSKTDVVSYEADANNNYVNYLHEDTYTLSGDRVTFTNNKLFFMDMIGISIVYYYDFLYGDIKGNTMKLTTKERKLTINWSDEGDPSSMEELGEKEFTLMKVQ